MSMLPVRVGPVSQAFESVPPSALSLVPQSESPPPAPPGLPFGSPAACRSVEAIGIQDGLGRDFGHEQTDDRHCSYE